MRAFAQAKTEDKTAAKGSARARASEATRPVIDLSSYSAPTIFRKAGCSCGGGCPACQARQSQSSDLKISHPNDPAEIEADQIADRVMRMPAAEVNRDKKRASNLPSQNGSFHSTPVSSTHIPAVHRKCDTCEEERDDEASEKPVMRKEAFASAASTPPPDGIPPLIRNVINSGGQPLDLETRNFFEPRFGTDLSHVRIHSGTKAAESARSVNALAFTSGRDIVFGAGRFAPDTNEGRRLIAHELTHVAQQRGVQRSIQRQTEGLPASALVPSLSEAPHGDQHCLQQHSCSVPASTPVSGAPLSAAEVSSQRSQVRTAITRSRATTPIAADNLEHWLDQTGTTRILPGSIFQAANSGVPRFLEHGLARNLAHLEVFRAGIQRRLAASDPESLMPAGTRRVMSFCNSTRAFGSRGGVGADLSIALGGFTVKSWVTLRLHTVPTSLPVVTRYQATVESWRVQVCDRYDWNLGALASMPFPVSDTDLAGLPFPEGALDVTSLPGGYSSVTLHDDWFRRLEAAGGGRQYALYSEIFDAPVRLRTLLEGFTFTTI